MCMYDSTAACSHTGHAGGKEAWEGCRGVGWAMISLGNCPQPSMRRRARKQDDSWWITSSALGCPSVRPLRARLRTAQQQGCAPAWAAPVPGMTVHPCSEGEERAGGHPPPMDNGRPIWRIPNFSMSARNSAKTWRGDPPFSFVAAAAAANDDDGRSGLPLACLLSTLYCSCLPARPEPASICLMYLVVLPSSHSRRK